LAVDLIKGDREDLGLGSGEGMKGGGPEPPRGAMRGVG